tara:strand:+ start:418 stop:1575 length:1158 start_codon:yes stop_codon:yes gene_type:complete
MSSYRHAGNIKAGLFLLGILLIIGLLYYTRYLADELRKDNREIVQLYAEIIAETVKDESDKNLDFVFDHIIRKVKFPIIQSDTEHIPQLWKNMPPGIDTAKDRKDLLIAMDRLNEPISLVYNGIIFGFLHYGDSYLIQKLQWWTYIELGSIGIFILLGFFGFSFIRNNEKRHIWVGMARETAHQLGTPVSALMGWVDWLKAHPDKTTEIIPDIKADLQRLEQIGRRFSKMGSDPDMEIFDLSERTEKVISYLNRRMPTLGKKVKLVNDIESGVNVHANGSLLSWSIENVIRNGIDAIDRNNGEIFVSLRQGNGYARIRIKDNGRGVPKKDWKNVFRPGFSTKRAGWGLGLSLAQRIIEEIHDGKLFIVESSSVTGTIFELTIPSQ